MTTLAVQHLGVPPSDRAARAIDCLRERAVDALAGRRVWCATGLPGGEARASALCGHLQRAGAEACRVDVRIDEPLLRLVERLDEMLGGAATATAPLGSAEEALFADAVQNGEALIEGGVRPDDVVVLHDPITAVLAEAVRERGAHAVWHVTLRAVPGRAAVAEASLFLRRFRAPIDAYVVDPARSTRRPRGLEHVFAMMPSADVVAEKEMEPLPAERLARSPMSLSDVGWSTLLADVVEADRDESVGGTLHARPAVAVR